MVAKRRAPSVPATNESAVEAASAASFHPLNAHTRAGARNASGRYSHCSGCIRVTVHDDAVSLDTIAMLRPGAEVSGTFACTRKDRLITKHGSPYLAVELRDPTGTIQARAFRDADALAGRFERGELVRAAGRVERFRDELVLELLEIERAGPDAAD